MEINETLSKQITETSYLTTENTKRYRPILRYFYEEYEKINYMLYKEDVWNYLKDKPNFENYTIEMCENDLTALVNWGNLTALQDTNNVTTVEEFKHRKFRYQLTEYAAEIQKLEENELTINSKLNSLQKQTEIAKEILKQESENLSLKAICYYNIKYFGDFYYNQDLSEPQWLFHGSPQKLEIVNTKLSHDSDNNLVNIDNAVFLTSSKKIASAYAFKDSIKENSKCLNFLLIFLVIYYSSYMDWLITMV